MYDGSKLATVGWTSAGQATRTSPAPDRKADAAAERRGPGHPATAGDDQDGAVHAPCCCRPGASGGSGSSSIAFKSPCDGVSSGRGLSTVRTAAADVPRLAGAAGRSGRRRGRR